MGVLTDRAAIVIGGGRGIGRAVAELFVREGARVLVNDLGAERDGTGADPAVAESAAAELAAGGGTAVASTVDASTEAGASSVVEACVAAFGGVDTLVYAAGSLADQTLARADARVFERTLAVHLGGSFFALRAVAPVMQRAGGGRVVLTTGTAGLLGNFGQAAYAAAAAGVYGLLRTASVELQRHRVFVNGVAPLAKTRLTSELPLFEAVTTMTPGHAAAPYLFFGSELSGDSTGNVMSVAGGRLSVFRLAESSGRFKETDSGVWTAEEIRDQFAAMVRP